MNVVTKAEVLQNCTSFADCLKYMMAACRQGKILDFTFWHADIKSLLQLDSKRVDFLLAIYREFLSAQCRQGMRKASLKRKNKNNE